MERLREPPGAGADFEHSRPPRNEALEIEIVDVLVDCAQPGFVEALPFSFSQLIEVGCDGGAIVRHSRAGCAIYVRAPNPKPSPEIGKVSHAGLLVLAADDVQSVPVLQFLIAESLSERPTIGRAQKLEIVKRVGVFPKPQAMQLHKSNGRFEPLIDGTGILVARSEERRVGKECRSRWSPYH